jgi:hypothetical protein
MDEGAKCAFQGELPLGIKMRFVSVKREQVTLLVRIKYKSTPEQQGRLSKLRSKSLPQSWVIRNCFHDPAKKHI